MIIANRYKYIDAYLHDVYQNIYTTPQLKQSASLRHSLLLAYASKLDTNPTGIIPACTIPDYKLFVNLNNIIDESSK
eukprot:UN01949